MTRERRPAIADALALVGGAALVASAFAHWVSRGDGNGLRGHALVDAILAVDRHVPGMSAARLTVLWYLVPASGAASWIATGLRGARSRPARTIAVLATAAASTSTVVFGWLTGFSHLGPGPWLALSGAAALCGGSWILAPNRTGSDPSARMANRGR